MDKITINNLNKTYPIDDGKLHILKDLSLDIDVNKITVILGKSGCGKTTLLRVLANLENKDSGSITYPNNYHSAFVFQEPRLMPWLSVKDNIDFGNEIKNNEKVEELAKMIGLSSFLNVYPNQLSGGMKARVALARALAFNPNLIYMDEPFAALDYFTRDNMQEELINLYKRENVGIVFVTHNIEEALRIAHKIVLIDQGQVQVEYDLNDDLTSRDILEPKYISIKKDILTRLMERGV